MVMDGTVSSGMNRSRVMILQNCTISRSKQPLVLRASMLSQGSEIPQGKPMYYFAFGGVLGAGLGAAG